MYKRQVKDSVEQRVSSVCHINIGERRSYDMNYKLRIIREAKQTICRMLNSLVFLNLMYSIGKNVTKSLRVLVHQEKDLKLENLIILIYLFPNTFTRKETNDIQYPRKLLERRHCSGT